MRTDGNITVVGNGARAASLTCACTCTCACTAVKSKCARFESIPRLSREAPRAPRLRPGLHGHRALGSRHLHLQTIDEQSRFAAWVGQPAAERGRRRCGWSWRGRGEEAVSSRLRGDSRDTRETSAHCSDVGALLSLLARNSRGNSCARGVPSNPLGETTFGNR